MKKIIRDFENASFVVCTDAGLSSKTNRKFNDISGRAFVTTQSIKQMKDYQKGWALSDDGWGLAGSSTEYRLSDILGNEKLFETYKDKSFFKGRWINENELEQRFIVTFSIKCMLYHRQLRGRQLQRAIQMVEKPSSPRKTDSKRFIKTTAATNDSEVAEKKSNSINGEKYLDECRYDGFYVVATNLEDDAGSIVKINSRRREVEESFSIMKSEFDARPVYLSREESSTVHFLTCFLALMIYRYLEKRIGNKYTCDEIIETLREMSARRITSSDFIPTYMRTDLTDDLHEAFGFRTDYEVVTGRMMNNILKDSQ